MFKNIGLNQLSVYILFLFSLYSCYSVFIGCLFSLNHFSCVTPLQDQVLATVAPKFCIKPVLADINGEEIGPSSRLHNHNFPLNIASTHHTPILYQFLNTRGLNLNRDCPPYTYLIFFVFFRIRRTHTHTLILILAFWNPVSGENVLLLLLLLLLPSAGGCYI